MLIFDLLAIFDCAALIFLLALAIRTAIRLPRLRVPPPSNAPPIHPSAHTPLVSVLIVVGNEANTIAARVRSLLAQTYAPFEILLLDGSTDSSGAIAQAAAPSDPRLRVIEGQPLLQGWRAPNWARHQLAHEAVGTVLIFTDASLIWQPDALKAVIDLMQRAQADALTVWPTPTPSKPGERPVLQLIHSGADPTRANTQFLALRKSAYLAISGHVAVRDQADEMAAFARLIKAKGLTLLAADGAGLIRRPTERRLGADLRAHYGNHFSAPISAALTLLIFGPPFIWLAAGQSAPGWPLVPILLIALSALLIGLSGWIQRAR